MKFKRYFNHMESALYSGVDTLQDVFRHPVQHGTEFVSRYWDVGGAVIAGLAVSDYQGQLFGDWRSAAVSAGVLATVVGPTIDLYKGFEEASFKRFLRNVMSGIGAMMLTFDSRTMPSQEQENISYMNKAFGATLELGAFIMDRGYSQLRNKA